MAKQTLTKPKKWQMLQNSLQARIARKGGGAAGRHLRGLLATVNTKVKG